MTGLEQGIIISAFGVVLTACIAYMVRLNTRLKESDEKINKQATEISLLQLQMSPFWKRVQDQIASDLHHPHPRYFEMDRLLERLEALTITPHDRQRLKVLLLERSTDMHPEISDSQRSKARVMLEVMGLVLDEAHEAKEAQS